MIVNHAYWLIKGTGLGLAWVPSAMGKVEIDTGKLVILLNDFSMSYDGYYMYYPTRHLSPLIRLFVGPSKLESH